MIVLDTHVWVWWISDPDKLSRKARRSIDEAIAERSIYVSSISAWEVALLVLRDRLTLTMDVRDWVARSESLPFLNFVPVDNAIALKSTHLPGRFHSDPADRIIVATALVLGAPLITKDRKLLSYAHARAIW